MNIRNIIKTVLTIAFALGTALAVSAQQDGIPHLRLTDKVFTPAPTKAVVELSANFMREKPEYEAELGDQALMGTVVEILEEKDGWTKIKSPDPYTAWVDSRGLVKMSDKEIADYLEAPKYICTAFRSCVYEEPSLKSGIVSEFIQGDLVRIMYKTITHTKGSLDGYVEGRAVLKKKFVGVVLPSGKTGYVPAKDVDVSLRLDGEAVKKVYLAPDRTELPFGTADGYVHFTVPGMSGYCMVVTETE